MPAQVAALAVLLTPWDFQTNYFILVLLLI